MIRFDAVLEAGRSGGAFVALPEEVVEELGQGTRFRARGTFGGVEYQSSTMPTGGGRACLGIHKATRQAAGVHFKEQVTVEIEVDHSVREIVVPPELNQALAGAPELQSAFERLAPSRRRELVAGVVESRKPETRHRRIAKIVEMLKGT